jgi:hypothetical protein
MKTGTELIEEERARQISQEGWTPEHDATHNFGELRRAAAAYALAAKAGQDALIPVSWPWSQRWWKPSDDPVRNLVKAGALIAAEIDRLQRPWVKANGPTHTQVGRTLPYNEDDNHHR